MTMKFRSDRQRKAMFSRLSGRFSDAFGNESTPTMDQLMSGHKGIWQGVAPESGFSFDSGNISELNIMGDESYEFSKKRPVEPEEYDIDSIPVEMFDVLGVTKDEVKGMYDKHGIRLVERKSV